MEHMTIMKKKRLEAKLTQKELANLIGVSVATISRYENGKDPIPDKIASRIARILRTHKSLLGVPISTSMIGKKALPRVRKKRNKRNTQFEEIRLRAGLTQKDLARELGVSIATVSNYENGKSPISNKYKRKLAQVLRTHKSRL